MSKFAVIVHVRSFVDKIFSYAWGLFREVQNISTFLHRPIFWSYYGYMAKDIVAIKCGQYATVAEVKGEFFGIASLRVMFGWKWSGVCLKLLCLNCGRLVLQSTRGNNCEQIFYEVAENLLECDKNFITERMLSSLIANFLLQKVSLLSSFRCISLLSSQWNTRCLFSKTNNKIWSHTIKSYTDLNKMLVRYVLSSRIKLKLRYQWRFENLGQSEIWIVQRIWKNDKDEKWGRKGRIS